jgi:hypothetical protein
VRSLLAFVFALVSLAALVAPAALLAGDKGDMTFVTHDSVTQQRHRLSSALDQADKPAWD